MHDEPVLFPEIWGESRVDLVAVKVAFWSCESNLVDLVPSDRDGPVIANVVRTLCWRTACSLAQCDR